MESIHSLAMKDTLIEKMLPFVEQSGWTIEALTEAVLAAGYQKGDAYRAFNGDLESVLEHYFNWTDRQMLKSLDNIVLKDMRTKDRVATIIMVRLAIMAAHKRVVEKTLTYLKHPKHALLAARMLYQTINKIWYAAGDQATDFNFYTKRALLASVYIPTVKFWMNDQSPSSLQTRAYLDQKLSDVMKIGQIKTIAKDFSGSLFKFFKQK